MDYTNFVIQAIIVLSSRWYLRALSSNNISDKYLKNKHGSFQALQVLFELDSFII